MKKLIILPVAFAFMFVSCKKEYTCECTVDMTSLGGTKTTASVDSGTKLSKKDAEAWCEESTSGYSYITCELK